MRLNPLCDESKPCGIIQFIHPTDKKTHTFHCQVNSLTGDRLSAFDHEPPEINAPISETVNIFKNIFLKSEVLDYGGKLAAKGKALSKT